MTLVMPSDGVIPFPISRARPPARAPQPLDAIFTDLSSKHAWERCHSAALVLEQFDDGPTSHLPNIVAHLLVETPQGFVSLVRRNMETIDFLKRALQHFTALDDMIGDAATRFLDRGQA